MKKNSCCGIIVAAGSSTRMAMELPKQFIPLCGVPAIVRTLRAFDACRGVENLVVVCRGDHADAIKAYLAEFQIQKPVKLAEGGGTRQESVAAGIAAAPEQTAYYAIHDGARSMITPAEIDSAVADAVRYGASALAVPVKDTIKTVDAEGFVASTPARAALWAVQTPQVFRREIYLAAMEQAQKSGADYTDDCQLVERTGTRVHLTRGEYTNIKLTTPEDIALCEVLLKQREAKK